MKCYSCGETLNRTGHCPNCGADVKIYKKILASANVLYNDGLEKAQDRDLTGAVDSLDRALRLNKNLTDARNLLGLVYFEMGEVPLAVEEWSISNALQPEDNEAKAYLKEFYRDFAEKEAAEQVSRKFNQALDYCKNGNYDLAMLQMKKVMTTNPNFVRGHQLMALLYCNIGDYDKAKSSLRVSLRIDKQNAYSEYLMKEVDAARRENLKNKSRTRKESVSYNSGNETIIQPIFDGMSTVTAIIINLVIGMVIGALIIYFLIVPSAKQNIMSKANQSVTEVNEQISAKDITIDSLEGQIESLQDQIAEYESADAQDITVSESYRQLLLSYQAYVAGDTTTMQTTLDAVDETVLADDAKTIYDLILEQVYSEQLATLFSEGTDAYNGEDYATAISDFTQIIDIEETYSEGQALYYLGMSYRNNGQTDEATEIFNQCISDCADTTSATDSQTALDEMAAEEEAADSSDTDSETAQ